MGKVTSVKKKIVLAHNFIGPHGGAEQSTYKIYKLLQNNGFEPFVFATNNQPYFEEFPHRHLFPSYTNYDTIKTPLAMASAFVKPFWNAEAKHKFDQFLDLVKPDLVHFGSIHWHLSPSVIASCAEKNIPTVMTLRESRHVCPAGTLLKGGKEYCEELLCVTRGSHNAIKHQCYEGSPLKSVFVAAEFKFRKIHKLFNQIDQYVCPSQALANYVQRSGIASNQINVIPNFLDEQWFSSPPLKTHGEYFLFAGRLSREKGVHILLEAMGHLPEGTRLKIAGDGDELANLKDFVKVHNLSNIEFLGHRNQEELIQLYRNCIAAILPCFWFENFGRTLIEAMACGRPAIASNIGGCGEVITHHETGLLVEPNNVDALAKAMTFLLEHPDKALEYGQKGYAVAKQKFSTTPAFEALLSVYDNAASMRFS